MLFLLILCTSLISNLVNAQFNPKRMENLMHFDKKKFHFGFSLGMNSMNFLVQKNLLAQDSLISLSNKSTSGFNIGIVSEYHFTPLLGIRFLPTLAFGARNLIYQKKATPFNIETIKEVESTYLQFPILLKYRSKRNNNFAAYIVGGANYTIDFASKADVDNTVPPDQQVIKTNKNLFFAEFGFGLDFFAEYFKFSPEIKLQYSLQDQLIKENTQWDTPLNSLRPFVFMISLHFEG